MTYYVRRDTKEVKLNNSQIKSLPEKERPYEKCFNYGAGYLTDSELLAVILKNGSKGENSVELARKILELSKNDGLLGICKVPIQELMSVKGIGKVKAIQLKCIAELSRRISKTNAKNELVFNSTETIVNYYMEDLRHKEVEEFTMLALNNKSVLLDEFIVSKGTVNASFASPREIFIQALRVKAVNIIVLHNHPSGDPTPSRNDIIATGNIKSAGEIIGIKLIDHIIIGDNKYVSFKEEGFFKMS